MVSPAQLPQNMDRERELGASMITLLVGLALAGLSAFAATQFFSGTHLKAKTLSGEAESLSHWSILLRQSFSGRCLDLEALHVPFSKSIAAPKLLKRKKLKTGLEKAKGDKADETLPALLRNSLAQDYEISDIGIIQRSSVIGVDPGRVLADLEVRLVFAKTNQKRTLRVPLLLNLDPALKAESCQTYPDDKSMCESHGGTYSDAGAGKVCHVPKT